MYLKNSFCALFLTICAIHLCKCQYPEDDDYSDPFLTDNRNNNNEQGKVAATTVPPQAPKDFFIPKLSFVPYSKIQSAAIRRMDEASKPAPPPPAPPKQKKKKAKKAPCSHPSHSRGNGDTQGGDYTGDYVDTNDGGHGDDQNDGDDYGGSQRSHGGPVVRAHHSHDSREAARALPKIREFINKYTIDLVENSDRY